MDDLRSDIRAAFEREQAAHPPAANLRHTVVRSVAAGPTRQRNVQWLAAVAVLVITVLVVVSLIASRLSTSGPVNSHKPTGEHAPPAGVNLVYVAPIGQEGTFTAYDWDGKPAGAVTVPHNGLGLSMSPDGQEFISGFAAKGGNFEFFDRLGHSLGTNTEPGAYGEVWADDNRSVCFMTQDTHTYAYTLWFERPAQTATAVAQVAKDSDLGQTVLNVVSCSVRNDTAIVVRTTVAWPTELWVVRLSDGRTMSHHTYTAQALATIVASADGRYIAETSSTANGAPYNPQNDPPAAHTVIRSVSDWTPVAQMDAGYTVLAFSGDGGSVLVRTQVVTHGDDFAIFNWGPGGTLRTVWQDVGGNHAVAGVASEPGGASFAIAFIQLDSNNSATWCPAGSTGCTTPLAVTIVHGDGTTVEIPGRYNTAW